MQTKKSRPRTPRRRSGVPETADPLDQLAGQLDAQLAAQRHDLVFAALGEQARASIGVAALSERTQLNRTALYEALSRAGNPRLRSVAAVLDAFGLRLSVQRKR